MILNKIKVIYDKIFFNYLFYLSKYQLHKTRKEAFYAIDTILYGVQL